MQQWNGSAVYSVKALANSQIAFEAFAILRAIELRMCSFKISSVSFRCNELGEWEDDDLGADRCLPGCDEDWVPFRGHCYRVYNSKLNYPDARDFCNDLVCVDIK